MQELEELKITMEALVREDRFNEFLNLFEPTASLALQEKNYNLLIDLYIKRSKIYFILGDIQSCIGDLKKLQSGLMSMEQMDKNNLFKYVCYDLRRTW